MSLGEKLYLTMILVLFLSFGLLMASLCWLDAIEDKAQRRRERRAAERPRAGSHGNAAVYH
jgi:high-affinity Fe2+/Pb2+ permease